MYWVEIWKSKPDVGSVCGSDIAFEPEFELLKEEVEKLSSLHSSDGPDWKSILERATSLLGEKSKDIWVFCYGIRAAYALEGLAAASAALEVMNDFLEEHWADLYPTAERPARRAAPFKWLHSRLDGLVPGNMLPGLSVADYLGYKTQLERLCAILEEKLQEHAPSFKPLIKQLPLNDSSPASASGSGGAAVSGILSGTAESSPLGDTDLPRLIRSATEDCRQLASHFLALSSTDSRVYLLNRAVLWSAVLQLPQGDAQKVTPLRPVPRDRALAYQAAVDSGQYAAVLPQLEQSVAKAPFWLEGHRMVERCLTGIGAESAARIVREQLKLLLQRFPELPQFKYYDGSPFCSPETAQWLEKLFEEPRREVAFNMPVSSEQAHEADGADKTDEQRLEKALELASAEGFAAGLASLGGPMPSRSRHAVKNAILQAKFCMARDHNKSAVVLLLTTYKQLTDWNLLDWEPELEAELLALLLSTKEGRKLEEFGALLNRLHWLKLDAAMYLTK